jgi:gliding motility-associated-like protein
VVKGFKILSSGNATTVSLDPSTTSVSQCLNDSYTINATVSPSGTYSYQWHDQNGPISGATGLSHTITSAVSNTSSYYLVATSASCTGQSSNITVSFQPVSTPAISHAGSATICEGESITLNSTASTLSKEWMLNNVVIPGATGSSYNATSAGSYSVRHFSPSNATCSAVSLPIIITSKPRPAAVINPPAMQFCDGGNGLLIHDSLPGESYTWYRNSSIIPAANSATLSVTSSGSYTIRVSGQNGCENISPASVVTVNTLPTATLNPSNSVLLCDGGILNIRAPHLSSGSYTWFNGTDVISNTSSELPVAVSGLYSVHILNTVTGCSSVSTATSVTITPPPSVFAGNDTLIASGQPIRLRAVSAASAVPRFEWIPATGLDNPFSANPVARLMHDQEYMVKAVYPSGCTASDYVLIKVLKGPAIYIPSAFTPNGDGLNDILKCTGIGLRSFGSFAVYNRLGQRVFYTTDLMQGWDGKWKGVLVETSSFVFIAEGIDYTGKPIVSKGTVTVIR